MSTDSKGCETNSGGTYFGPFESALESSSAPLAAGSLSFSLAHSISNLTSTKSAPAAVATAASLRMSSTV